MFGGKELKKVSASKRIWLGALVLLTGLSGKLAHAEFHTVALGLTYPTPEGYNFLTLNRSVGGQFEVWLDSPAFKTYTYLHLAAVYQPFGLRNSPSMTNNYLSGYVGLQFHSPEHGMQPAAFAGVDLGFAVSTLSVAGTAGAITNISTSFAVQFVPGFDVPLSQKLGLMVETPIRMIMSRTPLLLFDAVFSVRYSL